LGILAKGKYTKCPLNSLVPFDSSLERGILVSFNHLPVVSTFFLADKLYLCAAP